MDDVEWAEKIEVVRARCASHGGITTEDIQHALLHVNGSVGQAILLLMLKEKESVAPEGQSSASTSASTSPLLALFQMRKDGDKGPSNPSIRTKKVKQSKVSANKPIKRAAKAAPAKDLAQISPPAIIDVEEIPSPVSEPSAFAVTKPTAFKINLKKKKPNQNNIQTLNQKLERRQSDLSEDLFEKRKPRTSDTFPNSSEDEEEPEVEFESDKEEEAEEKSESIKVLKEEEKIKEGQSEAEEELSEDNDLVQTLKERIADLVSSTQPKRPSPPKRMAQTRMTIFAKEKDLEIGDSKEKIAKKGKKRRRENEWPEPGFDGFEDPKAYLYSVVAKRSRSLVMKNGKLSSVPNE